MIATRARRITTSEELRALLLRKGCVVSLEDLCFKQGSLRVVYRLTRPKATRSSGSEIDYITLNLLTGGGLDLKLFSNQPTMMGADDFFAGWTLWHEHRSLPQYLLLVKSANLGLAIFQRLVPDFHPTFGNEDPNQSYGGGNFFGSLIGSVVPMMLNVVAPGSGTVASTLMGLLSS